MNESGENLLSFCTMNKLVVMNTVFSVFKCTPIHGNILEQNMALHHYAASHCVNM